MKIKSAKSFRFWYKTEIKEIDKYNQTHDENFVGTYHVENGKKIKGFFEMYHGDKPDIASYLPSILKIAEDGQAIYEFLQNAVDCGSTHFYIFYNEKYFLAINNGSPFDIAGLQSILNIAQTTKKDPDKIGRFGIGFKLAHRLVGKNEGTYELVNEYKGPILFSWSKLEDLESLLKYDDIEPISPQNGEDNDFFNSPYLLKLLLTNFPSDPNETVKDINYNDQILFKQEELKELVDFLNESFNIHSSSLKKNVLKQGSLFFIKLGEDKKKLLDKDYSELVNGIQYSMNTLKNLQKVYINNDDIGKIPLHLETGVISKNTEEFERISPEYKEFDIKFAIGFNTIKFGNKKSYEQIKILKEKPNFYKYFPMGDEVNGFGFIIHCDSFSNEANRRKLHEDDINGNLFPILANHIMQRLTEYKNRDRSIFLNLYAALLLSDIPNRQNNKWLKPIFYYKLLNYLKKNIPTKNSYSDNADNVKINSISISLSLSDFGLNHIQWFEWDNEEDKLLIDEATDIQKLGIKKWKITDLVENAVLENINKWITGCDEDTYVTFLNELEKQYLRNETKDKIRQIKLIRFSNGHFYSFNEIVKKQKIQNRLVPIYGDFAFFKTEKTKNVVGELNKLGIILSEINASEYPNIFSSIEEMPDEYIKYFLIAEKCKTNTLNATEKKKLFLNFINKETKFNNITEGTLKDLELFCDINSKIKPLKELIGNINTPIWLNTYKIKQDEYFPELNSYLISTPEGIFKEIYHKNQEEIITKLTSAEEIISLIELYQDNQKQFFKDFIIKKENNEFVLDKKASGTFQVQSADEKTRKFIEENCANNLFILPYEFINKCKEEEGIIKSNDLYSLILEVVDVNEHKETLIDIVKYKAKYKFLNKISEFRLSSTKEYTKEDYEYKILDLACNELKENDYEQFKDKVVIETESKNLKLSEIPPITEKVKIDDYKISLAKILPDSYENSDYIIRIINQFITLGLSGERINYLFDISEEPEPGDIYKVFSNQIETLENAEQLAFVILYNKYIEEVDLKSFQVLAKGGGIYDLTYDFYTKKFNFLVDDAALDDKYKGVKKIIGKLPFYITNDNQLLDEPYFNEREFICPDLITENLSDDQKTSLIEFLFNQWGKKDKKTVIKNIDWSKIMGKETENILGFNPRVSVYPTKYAFKDEVLPNYLINWLNEEEIKIDFLSDLGVWTEDSVIVELRRYLSDETEHFHNNHLAQEPRFNGDETILFNSFEWLREKEIVIRTEEQFITFKKVVEIINENRDNYDLIIEDRSDLDTLEELAIEWEDLNYEKWKENSEFCIFLYDGKLPRTVSLDEIKDYIFYRYNENDFLVDDNIIYINDEIDLNKILTKVASDEENDFTFEDLWQLFGENHSNSDFVDRKDLTFWEHKEGYTIVKKHYRRLPNRGKISFDDFILEIFETYKKHSPNRGSINFNDDLLKTFETNSFDESEDEMNAEIATAEQKKADRVVKEMVRKELEKDGFQFTKEITEEPSIIEGVFKDDKEFPLVVKSYINQSVSLRIEPNEWMQLSRPNSMLWVFFENRKLICLKSNEI